MPTVIADVTRHNNSATLMRLKTTIDQYVSMVYPVSVGLKVKWVLTGGQMTVLKGLDSVASTTLPGTDHPRRISAYVQSLAQNGSSGDIFHVLTYDQSVMDEVSKLDVNIKL